MGTRVYRFLRQPEFTAVPERKVPIRSRENVPSTPRNVHSRSSPRNTDTAKRKLRVRFVLPEEDSIQRKEIEVFPDVTEVPGSSSLPAICEFMIFSPKMNSNNNSNKVKQKTTLPKKTVAIVRKTSGESTNKKQKESSSNIVKLPPATPKYSKQELKIDSNCMLPEDYKDPTQGDTRRRILAWLNEAEKAKPAYRRRMDSFT